MRKPFSKSVPGLAIFFTGTFILYTVITALACQRSDENHKDGFNPMHVKLKLEQESYLVIHGESNVNDFQCIYENALRKDTLNMVAVWEDDCLVFRNATLNLAANAFDCGNRQMNLDLQNLLQSDTHPFIQIEVICIQVDPPELQCLASYNNNSKKVTILTNIRIAGTTRQQKLPVEISRNGNERNYTGTISINLKDYNIEPPTKMLGLVRVHENIEVHFFMKIALLESETSG